MNTVMTCARPATRWEDALPVGNGSLGALVHGNITREIIIVNHEALWIHHDKPAPPDISDTITELRELLANGEWAHIDKFLDMMLLERGYRPGPTDNYHPAFDLEIDTVPSAPFTGYRRSIDLATGVATVSWHEGSATHRRDCFVSRADDVMCVHVTCTGGTAACTVRLARHGLLEENAHARSGRLSWEDIPITFEHGAGEAWLSITGTYASGARYCGVARVSVRGGHTRRARDGIEVAGTSDILVLVKVVPALGAREDHETVARSLLALDADPARLLARHATLHRAMMDRLDLDLDVPAADRAKANEALLLEAYGGKVPAALVERMFHFGRHLLVSSSRPGGWPANLQGVWNGYYHPPWSSDYHNDENVQMNYWAALPGNLAETTLPYFDFYEACLPDCRRNARAIYGCRGILAPIAQTVKGEAPLYTGPWLNWVSGAGWLAQLFHEYWLFTRDETFLRDRAVPYLKEVASFYEDFLVDGGDGTLLFSPSLSPENVPAVPDGSLVAVNATMDVAVAREVLSNLVGACETLGIEGDRVPRWRDMLSRLPRYEINDDGAIKEWIHPALRDNYAHRHLSHLYPLFPGREIDAGRETALFEACRVAVEKRSVVGQEAQSGWSLVHMACVRARLGQGDEALRCLELLIRSCVGDNLFTYHNDWRDMGLTLHWDFFDRLFQIDANLGLVAAVLEMLLRSSEHAITVLPARPAAWTRGTLRGARTRTGATVSFSWDADGGFITFTLQQGPDGTPVVVEFPRSARAVTMVAGTGEVRGSAKGDACKILDVPPGGELVIKVTLAP